VTSILMVSGATVLPRPDWRLPQPTSARADSRPQVIHLHVKAVDWERKEVVLFGRCLDDDGEHDSAINEGADSACC
jgi:hypothetical protein